MEKKRELIKRAKGLLALVMCFGMMFGNSLVVFAANNYVIEVVDGISTLPSGLGEGTILTADDTIEDGRYRLDEGSGGVILIYQDADGNAEGRLEKTGADKKATVGEPAGISPSEWKVVNIVPGNRSNNEVWTFTLRAIPETPDPSASPSTGGAER